MEFPQFEDFGTQNEKLTNVLDEELTILDAEFMTIYEKPALLVDFNRGDFPDTFTMYIMDRQIRNYILAIKSGGFLPVTMVFSKDKRDNGRVVPKVIHEKQSKE